MELRGALGMSPTVSSLPPSDEARVPAIKPQVKSCAPQVTRYAAAEIAAAGEQIAGARLPLPGRKFEPMHRPGDILCARKAEVEDATEPVLCQPGTAPGGLAQFRFRRGGIGRKAVAAQEAQAVPGRAAQIPAVGGAGKQARRLGEVAGKAEAMVEQPSEHGFAGGAALLAGWLLA